MVAQGVKNTKIMPESSLEFQACFVNKPLSDFLNIEEYGKELCMTFKKFKIFKPYEQPIKNDDLTNQRQILNLNEILSKKDDGKHYFELIF